MLRSLLRSGAVCVAGVALAVTLVSLLAAPTSGWKLMLTPNYVHEDLVGKAFALLTKPEDIERGKALLEDMTLGDEWTDMPLGKDGELTHKPADLSGFLNLLTLSPFSKLFLLKQSQQGCLMHWHCMAPKLQGKENMLMSNDAVRSLILGQVSFWWDRAVATRATDMPLSNGYIGHMMHTVQDCHPRGHVIRDFDQLYQKAGDMFGSEDADEQAVMTKLNVAKLRCGRILYHQGDRAQNTAGIPPFDNDLDTHAGWDKLPHDPKSPLANVAPHEPSEEFGKAKYKPTFDSTQAARQLELEACAVFATYRVLRAWMQCLRQDASSTCADQKADAMKLYSDYVLNQPDNVKSIIAGGAWADVVTTSESDRDTYYQRTDIRNDDPAFVPIPVWVPIPHSTWNVSTIKDDPTMAMQRFGASAATMKTPVDLPLCGYIKGTTRDDFGAASKEAGPYTDFYNPVATSYLAKGGSPCTEDEECLSRDCGGSFAGQDYCQCGAQETGNCTSPNSATRSHGQAAGLTTLVLAALLQVMLIAAGLSMAQ